MDIKEVPEIFRGHLEECLRHIWDTLKKAGYKRGTHGLAEARMPIAKFCDVSDPTVKDWLEGKMEPVGETLIKLSCFLDLQGYRLIEFERLPKVKHNFAELIGYNILSIPQAVELLGYVKSSSLYPVLWAIEGISEEKERKMWDYWKSKREELAKAKQIALEKYTLGFLNESKTSLPVEDKFDVSFFEPHSLLTSKRTQSALCIMEGLLLIISDGVFVHESLQQKEKNTILLLASKMTELSSRILSNGQKRRKDDR